ncbi:alpha/beta hydrolase [Microgenomates group bacterium]|nr:alpha/beta hydrolase [Microgenomates group bacterium]
MSRRILLITLAALLVVVATLAFILQTNRHTPSPAALAALESSDQVAVTSTSKFLAFFSTTPSSSPPLILYPNWFFPPESYAPLAQTLAQNGFDVIIPRFPFDLSFLRPSSLNHTARLISSSPDSLKPISDSPNDWVVLASGKSGNHLAHQLLVLQSGSARPAPQRAIFLSSSVSTPSFANYEGFVAFISGSYDQSASNLPSGTAFVNIPNLDDTLPDDFTPDQLAALLETIQIFTNPSYDPHLFLPQDSP